MSTSTTHGTYQNWAKHPTGTSSLPAYPSGKLLKILQSAAKKKITEQELFDDKFSSKKKVAEFQLKLKQFSKEELYSGETWYNMICLSSTMRYTHNTYQQFPISFLDSFTTNNANDYTWNTSSKSTSNSYTTTSQSDTTNG